jgi:hypothetical protein
LGRLITEIQVTKKFKDGSIYTRCHRQQLIGLKYAALGLDLYQLISRLNCVGIWEPPHFSDSATDVSSAFGDCCLHEIAIQAGALEFH